MCFTPENTFLIWKHNAWWWQNWSSEVLHHTNFPDLGTSDSCSFLGGRTFPSDRRLGGPNQIFWGWFGQLSWNCCYSCCDESNKLHSLRRRIYVGRRLTKLQRYFFYNLRKKKSFQFMFGRNHLLTCCLYLWTEIILFFRFDATIVGLIEIAFVLSFDEHFIFACSL